MSSTPPIKLPATVDEWREQAQRYQGEDMIQYETLPHALAAKPSNHFGSASKVIYADWLHLRVLWHQGDRHPSHSILGQFGPRLEHRSNQIIESQNWYGAFLQQDPNPLAWCHMAGWKMSVQEIISRTESLMDIPSQPPRFLGDNPFEDKTVPTAVKSRPKRGSPKDYGEGDSLQYLSSSAGSRSPSGGVSAPTRVSPSKSVELDYWGSYGGSHRGSNVDSNSSPKSGRSVENSLINRFRPDEALINMSIISLLQGIWLPSQRSKQTTQFEKYDWSIIHQQFTISEAQATNNSPRANLLTARTDGCFRGRHDKDPDQSDVLAIIEVKPYRRKGEHNPRAVRIQEGAEMAAWIASEPKKGLLPSEPGVYRRLLISQDFDEIYISIAEFDDQYINYIRGYHSSFSIPRMPDDSPTRRGRTDQRDPRGPPKTGGGPKSKGPSGISSMFKSSQSSSSSRREALPPATPVKASIAPATPQAPRPGPQGIGPAPLANPGFLTIYEYSPFVLDKPRHIKALFPLLLSLMTHLARDDYDARLRELSLTQKT